MSAIDAKELLKLGNLEQSLAQLQEQVRKNAADPKLRVFLFQLLSVLGQWNRALTQLDVLANCGADEHLMARIFAPVVRCELLRADIFSGGRTPVIFGEPAEWMSWLVQACELAGKEQYAAAQALRDKAFEAAPATPGQLNGKAFEWMADTDPRLGPMFEVMLEGSYYWVPMCRVKRMVIDAPSDLRDLVWAPVQFVWSNGGEASGHMPVRYPGTESHSDNQLRLARKTEWLERDGGYSLGLGLRMFATDTDEVPLLECRTVDFNAESSP